MSEEIFTQTYQGGITFHVSPDPKDTRMSRSTLRWWLWCSLCAVALVICGLFGFFRILWLNDLTYIGFGVLAVYGISTGWIARMVQTGQRDFAFLDYIADSMERAGIFGTFCGLYVAFQAMAHRDAAGAWIDELMSGIGTKCLCSIVGIGCAFMLRTQIRILDPR